MVSWPFWKPLFQDEKIFNVDKAPRLNIRIDIWILLSDTICQLIQFYTNSEAALLSTLMIL